MPDVNISIANPGDIARVNMDVDGMIDNDRGRIREFEIIETRRHEANFYEALVSYGREKLYYSFTLSLERSDNDEDYSILKRHANYSKYVGNYVRWLNADRIKEIISRGPDGCYCSVCKEFYNMAVPNQEDGTLKCYSCRQNPMRAYY